jgi:ABC-type uncharacterized transport system auxiliary subunit
MMRGRRGIIAAGAALAGCSVLPARPYEEIRLWPLTVSRPRALPRDPRGPILLVRRLEAGPGLETAFLRSRAADGSVTVAHYEAWDLPPAQGVAESLRLWLEQCGHFAAVVAPGSRATADYTLEGELTRFIALPAEGRAEVALSVVMFKEVDFHATPVLQTEFASTATLAGAAAPDIAGALTMATASVFADIESAIVRATG